jgi:hypothetical protein
MAYIDMQLVKGPELKGHIGTLNDSGLLPEPIMMAKGTRIATLAAAFVKGIEAVNDVGKLDDVPEAAFTYYATIMKQGDPPKADADARTPSTAATDEATEGADADAKALEAKAAKAQAKATAAAAKKEEKKAKAPTAAEKKAAAAADKKAKAAADKAAKATAKKRDDVAAKKAKAAADKKAKAEAKAKAAAAKKAAAKPKAKAKPVLVKSAVFAKVLLSKKTKKWDVKALVEAVAEKTASPYIDTRRKCNAYIALLRTMGVLEDAGDKLVMAEWYRKALAEK